MISVGIVGDLGIGMKYQKLGKSSTSDRSHATTCRIQGCRTTISGVSFRMCWCGGENGPWWSFPSGESGGEGSQTCRLQGQQRRRGQRRRDLGKGRIPGNSRLGALHAFTPFASYHDGRGSRPETGRSPARDARALSTVLGELPLVGLQYLEQFDWAQGKLCCLWCCLQLVTVCHNTGTQHQAVGEGRREAYGRPSQGLSSPLSPDLTNRLCVHFWLCELIHYAFIRSCSECP